MGLCQSVKRDIKSSNIFGTVRAARGVRVLTFIRFTLSSFFEVALIELCKEVGLDVLVEFVSSKMSK